jgi:hypothetical protein
MIPTPGCSDLQNRSHERTEVELARLARAVAAKIAREIGDQRRQSERVLTDTERLAREREFWSRGE